MHTMGINYASFLVVSSEQFVAIMYCHFCEARSRNITTRMNLWISFSERKQNVIDSPYPGF